MTRQHNTASMVRTQKCSDHFIFFLSFRKKMVTKNKTEEAHCDAIHTLKSDKELTTVENPRKTLFLCGCVMFWFRRGSITSPS